MTGRVLYHPPAAASISQSVSETFSPPAIQFFPHDFAKDRIFRFLSDGNGSSRTWYNPRLSFGKIQLRSGLVSWKVEGKKKGKERGKRNGSGWKHGGKLSRPFFHKPAHTLEHHLLRLESKPVLPFRLCLPFLQSMLGVFFRGFKVS